MSRTDNIGTVGGKVVLIDIDDIIDYDPESPSTTIVLKELVGADDIAHVATVSDADDLGKQILGKHVRAKFKSTVEINGSVFSKGEDGRFPAIMYYNSEAGPVTILKGFLLQDDIQDAYLPPGSEVEVVIVDGLGLLREAEITELNGDRIDGTYRKIDIIAFALAKTGLKLPINVADNLFESRNQNRIDSINNCPYDQIYFDSYSLMKDTTTMLDCYTILEALLPRYTRLCQRNGEWWIMRLFEHRLVGWKYTRYQWDGTKINGAPVPSMKKLMGHQSESPATYFINNTTASITRRSRKKVVVRNVYQYPEELLNNFHFTRGDERTDIVSTFPDGRLFEIEGWLLKKGIGSTATAPTTDAFIERRYLNGYEEGKTVVIQEPTSGGAFEYIENQRPVYVCEKSIINYAVDFKLDINFSGTVGQPASHGIAIRLEAVDGTNWTVDENGKWFQSDVNWATNFKLVQLSWYLADQDEREFQTIEVNTEPLPKSGRVYVMLMAFTSIAGSDIRYSNQNLEVKPYINGSNTFFEAEKHTISQDKVLSAKEEYDLFAYDAPCRSLKGCMLVNKEFGVPLPDYAKTNLWVDMTTFGVLLPGAYPSNKKYGEMIAWDLWSQNKSPKNKLVFDLQGLDLDDGNHHDLTHIFSTITPNSFTANRWFAITSMDQNWKNGTWTGTMIELFVKDEYADFEGEYQFEYETKNN